MGDYELVEAGLVEGRGERKGRAYHLSAATYRRLGDKVGRTESSRSTSGSRGKIAPKVEHFNSGRKAVRDRHGNLSISTNTDTASEY